MPVGKGGVGSSIAIVCPEQVAPQIPAKAIQENISGVVNAQMRIQAGRVVEVKILSGPRVFHEAVRQAVMQYKCIAEGGDSVVAHQEFRFKFE